MYRLFSIARAAAVAALALGAGALLTPAPAEAQGRHGFSHGGDRFAGGGRSAGPRMRGHHRQFSHRGVSSREFAPRVHGRHAVGQRFGVRPSVSRHNWRPAYNARPVYHHRRGNNRYWPVAAGVGLGVLGAAAVANSGYYYTHANSYPTQCWREQRSLRDGFGNRVINVRVCPEY